MSSDTMSSDTIIAIAGILGGVAFFAIICAPDILKSWHGSKIETSKAETAAANAALKREMVAQGFSPDEIVRVMNAGPETGADAGPEAAEKAPVTADHR